MRSGIFSKIAVAVVECAWPIVAASQAGVAAAVFAMAGTANAVLINVNIDTTTRVESTLDGPYYGNGGGDVGTTWNQILAGPGGTGGGISGTNLVDSTGTATTVDFTSNGGYLYDWGEPDLKLLTGAIFQWVPTTPYSLTISQLNPSEMYDLYLASFHPNEQGNRALFSTNNTTTTVGTQIVDSGGPNGNDSTWVEGENYALFEDVEPDGNNEIIITIVGDWPANEKRAYLSGFQLKIAGAQLPGQAANPKPADGATNVWTNDATDLSWNAGFDSDSSDVYFGTDPTPGIDEFKGNQVDTSYDPGPLDAQTTYYWRIDSINTDGTTTGQVWSFTANETPSSGVNTFLVPIPVPGASWQELAYLAAVPASAAANTGGPSVIALDESGTIPDPIYDYLTLYNPNVYMIDPTSSLDAVTCYMAQTFWTTTTSVVLCDDSDYAEALAASALAGRMEVPLLYFDSSTGLSTSALDVIDNDLQCSTALTVSGNSTVTSQLSGIGVSQTSLADDKEIITWMGNNGYPVESLAVCNANDRGMSDYAPKGSLAAALLAAERNGAVAALTYDVEWNVPFFHSSQTTTKPAGLPSNAYPPYMYYDPQDLNYPLGDFTINGQTHDFVIARMGTVHPDYIEAAFIDFNDDGDYGDAGEYCPRTSEVTLNGKRYTVGVNSEKDWVILYGELRFSHPSDDELKEKLQGYHDQIGHHPKYMAMVGVLQVLPCAHALSYDPGHCDYVMTDNYFADVDDDPLYEIAIGRVVGENVTYVTLNATRCLTYDDLYLPWADSMAHMCPEEFAINLYNTPRQFENCGFDVDDWYTIPAQDRTIYGVFIQNEHGWPYGIEPPTFGPIAPSLVEAGGCNIAAIDEYSETHDWYDTNAVVLARRGAICLNAWVRGTGASKDWTRDNFYKAILYDGATLGEAHLHALNTMAAEDENWDHEYDLTGNMFYGDPAVTLYTPPAGPTYAAAHVTANGNTLTVHAPQTYWVDYIPAPFSKYVYTAPGLAGSVYEPAWTLSATYTTDLQVTDMTQESGMPSPLGWMEMREGQYYVIDEHYDNTRTIHWRIRLDEFNENNGQFVQTINQINYNLTGIICGDINQNGDVDMVDCSHLAAQWLNTNCQTSDWCSGADLDKSGTVDLADYARFISHWLDNTQAD